MKQLDIYPLLNFKYIDTYNVGIPLYISNFCCKSCIIHLGSKRTLSCHVDDIDKEGTTHTNNESVHEYHIVTLILEIVLWLNRPPLLNRFC